jgi:septum formation protein
MVMRVNLAQANDRVHFILASGSPRRRELLTTLGIAFSVIKPDIDETPRTNEPPYDYVARLSVEKANAVGLPIATHDSALILAADTVVILAADTMGVTETGAILGKPVDADDARAILRRLRGRTHVVCTALTLLPIGGMAMTELTRTHVTMRDYSDAEIEAYIETGDPFDKAGAYAIQHPIFRPVAQIDGSYTNVVGLPIETLRAMLERIGYPIPSKS